MDIMVQYDQESLAQNLGQMDTTPIQQVDIVPQFMSSAHSEFVSTDAMIAQEAGLGYMSEQSTTELSAAFPSSMHLSMTDLSMAPYMNVSMDTMESSQIHPDYLSTIPAPPAAFAMVQTPDKVDLSPDAQKLSASPPQSQIPSPSIMGSASSYTTPGMSSLDSALDPINTPGTRSRANTSLSPPSFPALSPTNPLTGPEFSMSTSSNSPGSLEESVSQQQPQTLIGKLLKDIAITAINAGDAFENRNGGEPTTKVSELRDRIMQVLEMLQGMSVEEGESLSFNAPLQMPPPPQSLSSVPMSVEPSLAEQSGQLNVSDQSRKRCASDLEEHRTVKAMKREPQDDSPLTLNIQDVSPLPPSGLAYTIPPIAPINYPSMPPPLGPVPPISRPQTPTSFTASNTFGAIKPQTPVTAAFPAFLPANPASSLTHTSASVPPAVSSSFPPPLTHAPWSDSVVSTRHQHSLSAGSIPGPVLSAATTNSANAMRSNVVFPPSPLQPALAQAPIVPSNGVPAAMSAPISRTTRSGSISGINFRNTYASPFVDSTTPRHITNKSVSSGKWFMGSDPVRTTKRSTHGASRTSPSDEEDEDDSSDSDEEYGGKHIANHIAPGDRHTSSASDVPAEYVVDVDRIFFEFLNKLCSNLDATDSKGEQIHQTLMPKKMQRLDESPDFRPFKFRIQAFTNSFMDELARQGYPEDKIPMKKARNYLWRQPHIQRFNEDGKKAKSKGNHIWIVEAKKAGEGQWEFRPFERKLAGTPPSVAYCGLRWSWKPHIWHPQFSFKKTPVTYSSPDLPPWLSWKTGELGGVPPPDAKSCTFTVVAKFPLDNQDDEVKQKFTISIAPASALDSASYSRSRRPSLVGEPPKRSTSDSALFSIPQRAVNPRLSHKPDTRVIQVLQKVAQRVTDEASQLITDSPPEESELHDLVKQKHVLETTVNAYGDAISGQSNNNLTSRRLAVAAQHVVLQAAQTVIADRTVANGGVPIPQTETVAMQSVSVNELTDKTQDAIAMAVKMNGAANEVDIIVTATSILKSQTSILETPGVLPVPATRVSPSAVPPSRLATSFPISNLSTLPEYT